MRRHLRILTVLTAFVAPCGFAQAQTLTAAKIDSINKATESFLALAKDSHISGKAPRYSDPAVKPLLDTVLGTKDIEGGKALPWSSVQLLQDWNQAAAKVGTVYYLAGTGSTDVEAVGNDPQKTARTNSNPATFAPELGRYYDAQIRIHSAMIDAATAELASPSDDEKKDPKFRATMSNISSNSAKAIAGVLSALVLDGLTDDWLLLRVVALLDITPKAARFMAPQDRELVKNSVIEVAEQIKNPDVKSGVNAVARGMQML